MSLLRFSPPITFYYRDLQTMPSTTVVHLIAKSRILARDWPTP
jgi:hypothetical protein